MASNTIACRGCGLDIHVPAGKYGLIGKCPTCGTDVVVERPGPPRAIPAPPREPSPPPRPTAPAPSGSRPRRPSSSRRPSASRERGRPTRRPYSGGRDPSVARLAILLALPFLAGIAWFGFRSWRDGHNDRPARFGVSDRERPKPDADGPVRLSLEGLAESDFPAYTRVVFPGVVYSGSMARLSDMPPYHYYALVVPADSDLLRRVAGLAGRAETLLGREIRPLVGRETPERLQPVFEHCDEFFEDLEVLCRIRETDGAIAIELAGYGDLGKQAEWVSTDQYLTEIGLSRWKGLGFGEGSLRFATDPLDRLKRALTDLTAARPPDLETALPDIGSVNTDRMSAEEIDRYNGFVELYNAEVERRRRYALQKVEEELLETASTLRELVSEKEHEIHAKTLREMSEAGYVFARDVAYRPRVFVKEDPDFHPVYAERHYRRARILFSTWPRGATVTIDGALRGTTPLLLADLEPGRPVRVGLDLAGHESQSFSLTPEIVPERATHVRRVLDAKAR